MDYENENQTSSVNQQRKNNVMAKAIGTIAIVAYTAGAMFGGSMLESYNRRQQPIFIEDGILTDKVNDLKYSADQVPAMYTLMNRALDKIVETDAAMGQADVAYDNLLKAHTNLKNQYVGLQNTMKQAQKNMDSINNYNTRSEEVAVESEIVSENRKVLDLENLVKKGEKILGN